MKTQSFLNCLTISLSISILLSQSHANQTQPISHNTTIDYFTYKAQKWRNFLMRFQEPTLKIAAPTVLAGALCFIAASISSAGGIGGGGLFVPILTIVAGVDLKTASSFSAFMVTGGSVANVMYNLFSRKTLIDYDIALLSEPCMLLGVGIGVICNLMFPEWLITVLFAVFLAWTTFKTCKNGVWYWNLESEEVKRSKGCGNAEIGVFRNGSFNPSTGLKCINNPLLGVEERRLRFSWMDLGVLVIVWFSFFVLYLVRGNRYGQSFMPLEPCGVGYWIVSTLQIPLAIAFTVWILCRKDCCKEHIPNQQVTEDLATHRPSNKLIFPLMALIAGILGGVFGIGGGILISPLLLQVGIAPEVTAATCSFMVFFSSTMSAVQYLLLGIEHIGSALIFAIICFVASLVGLAVIQKAIQEYGRASLIVFSVSIVMALSTVLITSFGAVNVWRDYLSGNDMGFKLPC
ncbi:TauE domain-containing protein [Cephalotus follicularis]|uniref:TauE domain-containing protein n=1 Tax=Cephalotus follicularis TaxID=3775 RepID=A0A1Q3BU05_CEPFO|nr:TauE domain-containing protein [Cephalotus follicularis]